MGQYLKLTAKILLIFSKWVNVSRERFDRLISGPRNSFALIFFLLGSYMFFLLSIFFWYLNAIDKNTEYYQGLEYYRFFHDFQDCFLTIKSYQKLF